MVNIGYNFPCFNLCRKFEFEQAVNESMFKIISSMALKNFFRFDRLTISKKAESEEGINIMRLKVHY